MRKPAFRIVSLILASAGLMLSFQNCGKAGLETEGITVGSSSSLAKDSAPFALDASFDQMSYNSCFGSAIVGKPAYYSIRAGAYEKGGVQVSTAYRDFAKTSGMLKPIYPNTQVTDDQIKMAIAKSDAYAGAVPQMAMRTRSNFQQVRFPQGNTATLGIDYIEMLGDLTDDRWLSTLFSSTGSAQYFNLAPGGMRNLEASLVYNKDESTAYSVRRDLSSQGMLTLAYRAPASVGGGSAARAPDYNDVTRVYGRGYIMGFESVIAPYTQMYANIDGRPAVPDIKNPQNILSTITEVDLTDPSRPNGSTWTCHPLRRYLVVRAEDAAAYCPMDPWTSTANAAYRKEMEIVRRQLKAEHWDVSINNHCIVPKANEGACYRYDTLNGVTVPIEYDQRKPCFQNLSDVQYTSPAPVKQCAQYVSFCTKN